MTDFWPIAASIGAVLSGLAGIVVLPFVGYQIKQAGKSFDEAKRVSELTALIAFFRNVTNAEDRLHRVPSEQKEQVYHEFLNLLETYAAASNSNLISGKAKEMIDDKLCTSVAVIENTNSLHQLLTDAITASNTFQELVEFIQRHRRIITQRFQELVQSQRIVSSQGAADLED